MAMIVTGPIRFTKVPLAALLALCCAAGRPSPAQPVPSPVTQVQTGFSPEQLVVFPKDAKEPKPSQLLQAELRAEAAIAIRNRRESYEKIKTEKQVMAYQDDLREFFLERLGGFPERSDLNPKILDSIQLSECRIDKIIFESQPKHYVSALLYIPLNTGPHPAVIVPCGHHAQGKIAYQILCRSLAKNGIAALCYDPIGQGERYQVLDSKGTPQHKSTTEHTLVGVGSILVGRNTATYRIWDGMRALDYLSDHPEIDNQRLGCTGNSGGGTLTEYLMALDPRIRCAAPSCCVTTFDRRLATIGPGDAEQNIFGQVARGLDHADYTIMRAPKPTLLCAATHDFVDITGSWDIFREAKRIYSRLGFSERVDLIEVDGKHGFTQPKREAVVRWMKRWLKNEDTAVSESPMALLPDHALKCTEDGQVQLIPGARSVLDLNSDMSRDYAQSRLALWQEGNEAGALSKVRELSGIRSLDQLPVPRIQSHGTLKGAGYSVEKIVLRSAMNHVLPCLLFRPAQPTTRKCVYLHSEGKHVDAIPGGPIETLVRQGVMVLALDPRGTGELGSAGKGMWGANWDDFFLSYLLGKSLVGLRAEDILIGARFLSQVDSGDTAVDAVSNGGLAIPLLHASALERELFARVDLTDDVIPWTQVVSDHSLRGQLAHVVHGALQYYDVTDLVRVVERNRQTP